MSCAVSASCAPTATNGEEAGRPSRNACRLASAGSWLMVSSLVLAASAARDVRSGRAERLWSGHCLFAGGLGVDATGDEGVEQVNDAFADLALGVGRHRADVRRQDDVGQVGEQGPGPLALLRVHVEAGASEPPGEECVA